MCIESTADRFFDVHPEAKAIFDKLESVLVELGGVTLRVTTSQIAFSRRRSFAWIWMPDRWLRGRHAPLVLSIAFTEEESSPRWKQAVQPSPGHWMHHLELWSVEDVDEEVRSWLCRAADQAT